MLRRCCDIEWPAPTRTPRTRTSTLVRAMGAGASASTIAWEPSCLTPSAAELVRAIKTGEKSSVDVVTAALERIDLVEGNNLRACVEVLRESALA